MRSLEFLLESLQGKKTNHLVDKGQTAEPSESAPTQHFSFVKGKPAETNLKQTVQEALREAGVDRQPNKLFDEINGFTVDLSPSEATQLREVPSIKSVEADRPLPLSPPVEVKPVNSSGSTTAPVAASSESSALEQEVRLEKVFVGNVIASSESDLGAQGGISTSALPVYSNGTASTGEVLPYGVKAVWGGTDISSKGNVGSGTYAFVIDSGVLDTTGDLLVNKAWSKSWVSGEGAFTDGNGHGTHVAGTIAALANGKGVVGVAPGAEVISLKVFNSSGGGANYSTIIDAVNYATQVINSNGLDKSKCVINMSLGGGFSSGLDSAVKAAANQGIKFAIAAGNSGRDADGYSPAAAGDHPNVYTISAVDNRYQMASWSNWDDPSGGDDVDFAAPGVAVRSYYKGGALADLSGTSMAAPHVAGLLLMGNVKTGDMVKANGGGYADPFALGTLPSGGTPTPPAPKPPAKTETVFACFDFNNLNGNPGEQGNVRSLIQRQINAGEKYRIDTGIKNFTDINKLRSVLSMSDVFVMTDMENQDPNNNGFFPSSAASELRSFVQNGGQILLTADDGDSDAIFLNKIFGWDLKGASDNRNARKTQYAKGTHFDSLTSSIDGTYDGSLSRGSVKDFQAIFGTDSQAEVALIGYGKGQVLFLGNDFASANYANGYWDNNVMPAALKELAANAGRVQPPATRIFEDDFSSGSAGSLWSSISGSPGVNNNFRGRSNSLFFGRSSNYRQATTIGIEAGRGGSINFDYINGNGSNGGERVDSGENIVLEYSTNNGQSFKKLYTFSIYTHSWTNFKFDIPQDAQSAGIKTQFRWRQLRNSGSSFDHWAIDNIRIEARSGRDDGDAEFKISGSVKVGQTVTAVKTKDDPDGNGTFAYSWETSADKGSIWKTVGTGQNFKIPATQSGQQLRLRVQYQDGEGFKENIATAAVSIPLNEVIGTPGGDYIVGENGSSKYTFGGGYDIMDYSSMSAPITLVRGGKVDKGVNGTDTFADFPEELIATSSLNDWVDGLTGGGKIASLDVNLAADSLKVSGIPGIGSASITIRDFEHVKGSDTADTMVGNTLANKLYGNGGNDVIDGGTGNDDIQGGTGDDVLKGGTGNDSLSGGDGADRIDGGTGNDTINAGNGNDVMLASVGNDTCTFGSGYDTADYTSFYRDITLVKGGSVNKGDLGTDIFKDFVESIKATTRANDWIDASTGSTASIDVNLASQSLKVSGLPGVGTFTFNVQNFEHVKGSNTNDRIQGDSKANILIGNGGNDVMTASAGNDTYTFGSGYDTIDYSGLGQSIRLVRGGTVDKGSKGKDTFTDFYESIKASTGSGDWIDGLTGGGFTASLNADLQSNSLKITGLPGVGTVSVNVQNFENIDGSDTADRLKGDSKGNILRGNGGNDVMLASAGNDTYTFGSGSDTIDYSSLGQAITLNKGGTVSKGSAGKDTFTDFFETIRASSSSNDWIDGSGGTTASIDANLASQKLTIKGIPGLGTVNTTVQNFENVRGTNYSDTIAGDSGNNTLIGDGGNDTISTGGGRDSVDAGSGNDSITVTSAQGGSTSVTTGSGQDTVVFTKGYYQSLFLGGAAALTITDFTTGVGGDLLDLSQLFRDVAVGFDGSNPFLNGYLDFVKSGTDLQLQFDADGAFDTAFSAKTIALLKNTKRTDLDKSNFNPAYDIPPPIIQGTNRSERINGTDEGEWIYAYNGFDTINAQGGADRLYGGYGNDTLNGGDGNDELYGELDDDNLYGGNGDDRLTGGDGADYLDGGNGSDLYIVDDERDTIKDTGTDGGIDTVIFRYYSDKYTMGEGIEKVVTPSFTPKAFNIQGNNEHNTIIANSHSNVINGGAGNDIIKAGGGNDILIGGSGNDTLFAEAGDDKVDAGSGNDLIIGGSGLGDDIYNGGAGTDTLKYTSATAGITVNLLKGKATSTAGKDKAKIGNDTINSVENLIAGYYSDRLTGTNGSNSIQALSGNDWIYGALGNDTINGGSGRDTAQFSSRSNRINLNTTRWQNTGDGKDRLISIENVNAGSGNDIVTGNKASNALNGQAGNDRLYGGGGNDLLIGGGGKDRVWGQGGRDTFHIQRGDGYTIIEDFNNGQDRIQLGSGASGLKMQNRGDDVFLYQRGDLMAIVEDAAGDLQRSGNYLA